MNFLKQKVPRFECTLKKLVVKIRFKREISLVNGVACIRGFQPTSRERMEHEGVLSKRGGKLCLNRKTMASNETVLVDNMLVQKWTTYYDFELQVVQF